MPTSCFITCAVIGAIMRFRTGLQPALNTARSCRQQLGDGNYPICVGIGPEMAIGIAWIMKMTRHMLPTAALGALVGILVQGAIMHL